jgi:hypothetical protein
VRRGELKGERKVQMVRTYSHAGKAYKRRQGVWVVDGKDVRRLKKRRNRG